MLICVFLPFIIFTMLHRSYRPSLKLLVISGYLTITVLVGFLGSSRDIELRQQSRSAILIDTLKAPQTALERISTGADNDMYDAFANLMTVVPSELSFQHGGSHSGCVHSL